MGRHAMYGAEDLFLGRCWSNKIADSSRSEAGNAYRNILVFCRDISWGGFVMK